MRASQLPLSSQSGAHINRTSECLRVLSRVSVNPSGRFIVVIWMRNFLLAFHFKPVAWRAVITFYWSKVQRNFRWCVVCLGEPSRFGTHSLHLWMKKATVVVSNTASINTSWDCGKPQLIITPVCELEGPISKSKVPVFSRYSGNA